MIPAAVLIVGVVLSALGGLAQVRSLEEARDRRFDARAELVRNRVQERLISIEDATTQSRNALVLLWPVDRPTFADLAGLAGDLEVLRASRGVSFLRAIPVEETEVLEARVRADDSIVDGGYPGFEVTPATTGFDERFVVEYIEPLAGNESALGYDVGSDPDRRRAVEAARDRGEAVATRPITLVQEGGESRSILLMAAVYDGGEIPTTAPARRRHFVGAVSIVVRIEDLLVDVLGVDTLVEVDIYDVGPTEEPPRTALDPDDRLHVDPDEAVVSADGTLPDLHVLRDLDVGGRRWRMAMAPGDDFDPGIGPTPWLLTGAGLVVSVLLAGIVASVAGSRDRAEALARRRTAEVRQLILDAPEPTLVVAPDGTITLASRRVTEVLGWPTEDLVGQPIEVLVPEHLRAAHRGHRAGFARMPSDRLMGSTDVPFAALRADGEVVPTEVSLAPIEGGSVIASLRDVTVQEATREALRRSNEQKTAFLGTVSHELRTPLTAIKGFVALLRQQGTDLAPEQHEEFLARVARNADALHVLIDELLEYTRLERAEARLSPAPGDLAVVVGDVLDALEPVGPDHHLVRDLGPAPCAFDRDAVGRIVTNLVSNAWRYAPPGTTVTVRVAPVDGGAELVVSDQGPGVPADERPHVFERFWRGSQAAERAIPGTGIGLAVVSELSGLQGGTVTVDDAEGGGARFRVVLPDAVPDPSGGGAQGATRPAGASAGLPGSAA